MFKMVKFLLYSLIGNLYFTFLKKTWKRLYKNILYFGKLILDWSLQYLYAMPSMNNFFSSTLGDLSQWSFYLHYCLRAPVSKPCRFLRDSKHKYFYLQTSSTLGDLSQWSFYLHYCLRAPGSRPCRFLRDSKHKYV
jgi:hypothetical protein